MKSGGGITDFLVEMSTRQTSITRLFSPELLAMIRSHLGFERTAILCFDEQNRFLSWTDEEGVKGVKGVKGGDCPHAYAAFAGNDVVEHAVYYMARQDGMTYFNTVPRVCRSTDIISDADYDGSSYVRFLEENVGAHYSVTLPFGTFGFIQIVFFRTLAEGDFSRDDLLELEDLYVIIAGFYSNFKKQEQERIASRMKDQVIRAEEKAYFIADGFGHVLMCNSQAASCLRELFGAEDDALRDPSRAQLWLPMILGNAADAEHAADREIAADAERTPHRECTANAGRTPHRESMADAERTPQRESTIRGFLFRVYIHEQKYEHGIIETYYLVTVKEEEAAETQEKPGAGAGASEYLAVLTASERQVAELLGAGRTYRQIAEELFISYHTVKKHVENIYSKLGIGSRYQLYQLMGNRM